MEPSIWYSGPDSSNQSSYLLLRCLCNLLSSLNLTNEGQRHFGNGLPICLGSLQRVSEHCHSHHSPAEGAELSLPELAAAGCAAQEQHIWQSCASRERERVLGAACCISRLRTRIQPWLFTVAWLPETPNWQRDFRAPARLKFIYPADFS